MEIVINHNKEEMVIALTGRLDTVTSLDLLKAFNEEDIVEPVVTVDMKNLEYISSAGLRALLSMKKELKTKDKVLEVANLNKVCTEVFKVTGFINILTVK
jgi:anti-sigma B factor antagonist